MEKEEEKMSETEYLKEHDEEQIRDLLVGRRIVEVREDSSELVLDDGTVLKFEANQGWCCGAGDYEIKKLAGVENAIMAVDFGVEDIGESEWSGDTRYSIFVYAEGVAGGQTLLEVEGNDGNGYYGTGYSITVTRP